MEHQAQAIEVCCPLCFSCSRPYIPVQKRTLALVLPGSTKDMRMGNDADHDADCLQVTLQGLEKYLMTKIYHKTFAVSALDRERDEALSVRMAALNFIKPQHLDIPRAFQDEKSWLLAMKELHKINSYKVQPSEDPN